MLLLFDRFLQIVLGMYRRKHNLAILLYPITAATLISATTKIPKQKFHSRASAAFVRNCHRSERQVALSSSSLPSTKGNEFLYTSQDRNFIGSISSINSRLMMSSSTTTTTVPVTATTIIPGRPTWQQTMIRIKDPVESLKFYCDVLGMTLIDSMDFPQYSFSIYFVTTLPPDVPPYTLTPGTKEAHEYLWSYKGVTLELTHNHGTEKIGDSDSNNFKGYHIGNKERDGFGHIAVSVNDVYSVSDKLESIGCTFQKKPNEGRMKGLAFVLDPDGYWVEIVERGDKLKHQLSSKLECNFSQTMLRIKDPKKSIPFYLSFGMKLLNERHFDSFSLYFLGSSNVDESVSVKDQFNPVLELTHNHGTETDETFVHYNGNEKDRQGFGHIGFLVDDVYEACDTIRTMGYGFRKEPDDGTMKGLAFCYDPDGYSIEIIKRGGIDFGDVKKE